MPNLSNFECKAVKGLRDDDNTVVLPADNGRSTVLMDKCDYERKVRLMLDDSNTYKKLR